MRPLLLSEAAIVRAACNSCPEDALSAAMVVRECHAPPFMGSPKQWFNTDFEVLLEPELPSPETFKMHVLAVRPKTLGAEYFVAVRHDGTPVWIQLVGGETFGPSYFITEIALIDAELELLKRPHMWRKSVKRLPFLRIVSAETGVVFAAATCTDVARLIALPGVKEDTPHGMIAVRTADDGNVFLDGVLQTD